MVRCAVVAAFLAAATVSAQPQDHFAAAGAESRLELGRLALENGELENAQRLLREAVQLLKIDKGLRTQAQLDPLRQLMWAEMRAAQWSELETSLEHFYWLLGQIQDSTLSSQLAIIRDLRQLNLEAAAHPNNPAPAKHFSGAQRLNWQALSFIEATVGSHSPRLVPWLYDGVLLQHLENRLNDRRGLSNYQYKTNGSEIVSGWSLTRNEINRANYAIGTDLLDRIEAICLAETSRPEHEGLIAATVKLYRGDWALLAGHTEEAVAFYEKASDQWPGQRPLPATLSNAPYDLAALPRKRFELGGPAPEPRQPKPPSDAATGFNGINQTLFAALGTLEYSATNPCSTN